MLDEQTGELRGPGSAAKSGSASAWPGGDYQGVIYPGDVGGASRFFPTFRYEPKPSTAEREAGLSGVEAQLFGMSSAASNAAARGEEYDNGDGGVNRTTLRRNVHPTVKPVALMRWLVRLVTPPKGHVLDPFAGSGTTGVAALWEGFQFTGIERDPEYAEIARSRIGWAAEFEPGTDTDSAVASDAARRKRSEAGQESLF
jgi:hypothetical protein